MLQLHASFTALARAGLMKGRQRARAALALSALQWGDRWFYPDVLLPPTQRWIKNSLRRWSRCESHWFLRSCLVSRVPALRTARASGVHRGAPGLKPACSYRKLLPRYLLTSSEPAPMLHPPLVMAQLLTTCVEETIHFSTAHTRVP